MGAFKKAAQKLTSEKMSAKSRKRLIVFIAIITLLSMTTSTVAWFTINTFAGVDSLDIHISVAAQLKVAMHDYGTDLSRYGKVITNEMIDEFLAGDNTRLEDIILDPVTTSDGVRFTNKGGTQRERNKRSFLEFDCYFIATEDMWVHLTTEDADEQRDTGTRVTSDSPSPQNEVTDCSRVGFTTDSNGTACFENNKGAAVTSLSTFDLPSGTMVYSDNTRLFHLDEMTPKKVTVRLWIEGEDPQCDDDVQDADLQVRMSFVGCDNNNVPIS
ncbi:MAG: hypothetical protein IJ598_05915 [Ruminococcus sp.]|nr:hypothetical protein [Ruminococcus sp.]